MFPVARCVLTRHLPRRCYLRSLNYTAGAAAAATATASSRYHPTTRVFLPPSAPVSSSGMFFNSCCRNTGTRKSGASMSTMATPEEYKYVVLGGGTAAGYIAKAFVDHSRGKDELALISRDRAPPFERPALSKGFLNAEKPARLPGFHTTVGSGGPSQDETWYKENGIRWFGQQDVTSVDLAARTLTTDRGHTFSYHKLIVATGMEAAKLPPHKVNEKNNEILYLRSLDDAEQLHTAMADHPGGRALVIGGGYIGTEVTAKLLENNLQVTIVFPEDRLLGRLFTEEMAGAYAKAFSGRGVNMVHSTIKELQHDASGKLTGAALSDGTEVSCDIVVAGIGARPEMGPLAGKLDEAEGGIKVDAHLRTSDPNVFAVGDVIAFPLAIEDNTVVRQEHVQHARDSAKHVVEALLVEEQGGPLPAYSYLPYFYSRCLGFNWKFYGVNQGDVFQFGEFEEGKKYGALWVRNQQVVGTFLESGNEDEHAKFKEIARTRPSVDGQDGVRRIVHDVLGSDFAAKM